MLARIRQMFIKEFIQLFRDPKMRGIIFMMPFMQLLVFSYAVTTDVKNIAIGLYDLDNSVYSRRLAAMFVESGFFEVKEYITEDARTKALMDHSRVQAILQINKGFDGRLRGGKTAPVQLILDGTDSNTSSIVLNYANKIVSVFSQAIKAQGISSRAGPPGQPGLIEVRSRAWFNENLESRIFYVPGLIALILSILTLTLTSTAIVREREIGTMEQIMVTPITPAEFIIGKTLPFALVAFVDVFMIMLIGLLWFKVPMRGSILLLLVATVLYLMTTLGTGLFISTVSKTQQQSTMATFFFVMPTMLLSGFLFPVSNMPEAVQWLTLLNPMRYFLIIIRGIFLKGVGLDILWPQMLALLVIGVFMIWLSSRKVKKTLA